MLMVPLHNRSERFEFDSKSRGFSAKLPWMGEAKPKRPWVAWTLLALGAIERVVGWGGSVDFILSRWNEPDWVGRLMSGIMGYSNIIGLALLLGGIALLIRYERHRAEMLYGKKVDEATPPVAAVSSPVASLTTQFIPKPRLNDADRAAGMDTLAELHSALGEWEALGRDLAWTGGAPQKLPPHFPTVRELARRRDWLQSQLQGFEEGNRYILTLLQIDLSPVHLASIELAGPLNRFADLVTGLEPDSSDSVMAIVKEIAAPLCAENAHFRAAVEKARERIIAVRQSLN